MFTKISNGRDSPTFAVGGIITSFSYTNVNITLEAAAPKVYFTGRFVLAFVKCPKVIPTGYRHEFLLSLSPETSSRVE